MNEIERLISGLPRPSPSEQLDVRIARIVDRSHPVGTTRERTRRLLTLAACTAAAGLFGFLLGRNSAPVQAGSDSAAFAPAPSTTPASPASRTVSLTVHIPQNEGLARFVMPPKRLEGLFGSGSLEERTDSPQLQ